MKKKHITIIAIMGLFAWSFNACEGPEGPAGTVGIDGTDGTDGIDATGLPPAGTYFSIAVNNNAGDMQFGSFVNYLAFDSVDADVATSIPQIVSYETSLPPEIDGSEATGEWTSNSTVITLERITDFEKYDGLDPVGVTSVKVKAMYDELYVYFQLSWSDATNSYEKSKLTYSTDGGWSSSGNEDRFYFMWPITGYPDTDFADGNGCVAFCHYDENAGNGKGYMFTEFPDQLVDTWQWKASRANPVGYVHDKHLIYQDTASPTSGRKGDQGNDPYIENKIQGSGFPNYMHITDPNGNAGYPSYDYEMIPFDASATFSNGATIPGVFLRDPNGSGADVLTKGVYSDGGWFVEVKRLRNTGHGDDHQFLPE